MATEVGDVSLRGTRLGLGAGRRARQDRGLTNTEAIGDKLA